MDLAYTMLRQNSSSNSNATCQNKAEGCSQAIDDDCQSFYLQQLDDVMGMHIQ